MITSLIEEAEAIGWYEQRISVEKDKEAQAIMKSAQKEEIQALRHGPGISTPPQTNLAGRAEGNPLHKR